MNEAIGYSLDGDTDFRQFLGFGLRSKPDGKGNWVLLSSVDEKWRGIDDYPFHKDVWVKVP
jgi:hypothetical protein